MTTAFSLLQRDDIDSVSAHKLKRNSVEYIRIFRVWPCSSNKYSGNILKILLPTLLLSLASTGALADWTSIGESRDFPITYYLDFKSVHKQGQSVTVWELMDFDTPQGLKGSGDKYLSSTLEMEFDCNERQSRILSLNMFAGNMGMGKNIFSASFPSAPWEPVPPVSVTKELWNSACVKK